MPAASFVYAPALSAWSLADDHPFRPVRLDVLRDLLLETQLLDAAEEVAPHPLPTGALEGVHDAGYVAMVRRVSRGERPEAAYRYGLGTSDTPFARHLHEAVTAVCAATWTGMDLLLRGTSSRVAAFSGGLHHAMPDRASGFCVYNDLAIAIEHARREGARVAYIDLDAHHGDGVQTIFYDASDVLTISLHESGRYLFPGTGHSYELGKGAGRGWSLNVPLEPFSADASYLEVFDILVPDAIAAFQPDVIVLQAGADTHTLDPLADLSLSLHGMRASYERVVELADSFAGGRLLVTGGGGYAAFQVPPRAWAHAWSVMTGRRLPDPLPEAWRERWRARAGEQMPERAFDAPADPLSSARRHEVRSHNVAMARRLHAQARTLWGGNDRQRPLEAAKEDT